MIARFSSRFGMFRFGGVGGRSAKPVDLVRVGSSSAAFLLELASFESKLDLPGAADGECFTGAGCLGAGLLAFGRWKGIGNRTSSSSYTRRFFSAVSSVSFVLEMRATHLVKVSQEQGLCLQVLYASWASWSPRERWGLQSIVVLVARQSALEAPPLSFAQPRGQYALTP